MSRLKKVLLNPWITLTYLENAHQCDCHACDNGGFVYFPTPRRQVYPVTVIVPFVRLVGLFMMLGSFCSCRGCQQQDSHICPVDWTTGHRLDFHVENSAFSSRVRLTRIRLHYAKTHVKLCMHRVYIAKVMLKGYFTRPGCLLRFVISTTLQCFLHSENISATIEGIAYHDMTCNVEVVAEKEACLRKSHLFVILFSKPDENSF